MNKKSVIFGICLGVLFTCFFGLIIAAFDTDRSYTVSGTDDHSVYLKAEDGILIELQLENVPDVSCFEHGAVIIIDRRP